MKPLISAIIPVRNEKENISEIFLNLKPLGGDTEAIFVEGGSSDGTWDAAHSLNNHKNRYGVLFRAIHQKGKGKASAVEVGFSSAKGEVLIIVDADMSISQKDLKKIISLFSKHGSNIIASGNRLKGIRKPKAFYWINYIGNYFFRIYYSLLLMTKVMDISCGTKAMDVKMWKKVKALRAKHKPLDMWGDIDWLYYGKKAGASLKFTDINYQERKYGESKLQNVLVRWRFAFQMFLIGIKITKMELANE